MKIRANAPALLLALLSLGIGAAAGCHRWHDWDDDRGLEFSGHIESVDGSDTLRRVRFGVDDEWRDAGFGDTEHRIALDGRFDGGRGTHTVRVTVRSQTSSPNRYRITGTLSYIEANGLFSWRTLSSVDLPGEVRTLETDETVTYTVHIP